MGEQPRNAPLPPHRKWWVERMSLADRRSYLLAEELERLAVSRKGEASSAIRGFLVAWRKATQGGNPIGLELKVKRAKANMAIVFAHSLARRAQCAGCRSWWCLGSIASTGSGESAGTIRCSPGRPSQSATCGAKSSRDRVRSSTSRHSAS